MSDGRAPAAGRVTCPVCGRDRKTNTNGKMFKHNHGDGPCPGTGLTVQQVRPGMTYAESLVIRYPTWSW